MNAPSTPPLLEVEAVDKVFDVSAPWLARTLAGHGRSLLHAVQGASFAIASGETLALVGESGCGKSTLARVIVGLHAPTRGTVRYGGRPIAGAGVAGPSGEARRHIQMIFQDPYASLDPHWRVGRIVAEPIRTHGLRAGHAAIEARVAELLGLVGLAAADAAKFPHQFSGGQRQRISIARALAAEAEFLVCDEPTSALDVSVQAQVLNLMKDLQRKFGLTCLFISHNLAVVHFIADRVGVMYLGRLVELGRRDAVFADPQHPYTRMLLAAIPDLDMGGRARIPVAGEVPNPLSPPPGCAFHPRCPHADDLCRREPPAWLAAANGSQVACHAVAQGRLAAIPVISA